MLLFCPINTHFLTHDKSSSISQFINGKSRKRQKLLRYLSGIVTSTFKVDTFGCGGQSASPSFPDCSGLLVFSYSFLFYIKMIYHLKYYKQHHQFRLYNNSINFLMSWNNFDYSSRLYIGMMISRSSALSINVLLIFQFHDLNGALFLKTTSL